MKFKLTRDVTPEECFWLDRVIKKGEIVEEHTGPTYGCITYSGTACIIDGIQGFCELPSSALELIE